MGVRISWLTLVRNADLSLSLSSALSFASKSSASYLRRSVISLIIILVKTSSFLLVKIEEETSAGNFVPSFLINEISPFANPYLFLISIRFLRSGSSKSTSPNLPARHISAFVIPNISQAASLAVITVPSGLVSKIASILLAINNLVCSSLSRSAFSASFFLVTSWIIEWRYSLPPIITRLLKFSISTISPFAFLCLNSKWIFLRFLASSILFLTSSGGSIFICEIVIFVNSSILQP